MALVRLSELQVHDLTMRRLAGFEYPTCATMKLAKTKKMLTALPWMSLDSRSLVGSRHPSMEDGARCP